ncbi:hypothetical protein EMIHUDRAFT_454619 [Emiliania huxleyi CCMP1516]|uniref:Uncharacterized protein n=2 Tax=Emiliania huxleyi TaxID=2903 RepID=A0A0D3KS64_EMIH1|nr:hypothetical protein EMIHUDRAFT_454619 [Emiliania huxleyi CCMP1516]EOD38599.1 hypothetical protein EMIHUDRAFT_454619 [Emiliania huxleyi CCMP1516]|eukprot:XP_005791028.1 hypothetical protein EMIHUDRAFT_454619 [Emiliania huxleyi CCMP1516]
MPPKALSRFAELGAVTIYPTSIVDGKLENCASKVAQIRLSRRAELVSPVEPTNAGRAPLGLG